MNTPLSNIAILLLGASQALLAAPSASADLSITFTADGATQSDTVAGVAADSGGTYYGASLVLPAADVVIDAIGWGSGELTLSATLVITNHQGTASTIDLDIAQIVDMPAPGFIRRGTLIGLVPFGGGVSSQPGALMHELLVDGAASPGLLPAGYSSSDSIGPVIDMDASDMVYTGVASSFGHRWQLMIDAGASVVLNAVIYTQSFDLDQDGIVGGADLGLLLRGWGLPGPADFNADGIVDAADLGLLMTAWN